MIILKAIVILIFCLINFGCSVNNERLMTYTKVEKVPYYEEIEVFEEIEINGEVQKIATKKTVEKYKEISKEETHKECLYRVCPGAFGQRSMVKESIFTKGNANCGPAKWLPCPP